MLVAGLEAWVESAAGRTDLIAHRYVPDVTHPSVTIDRFARDPWPTWTYRWKCWSSPDSRAPGCDGGHTT
jgi:hypothetical protein